jgi:DNA sulfur modification protein DndB
MASTFPALKGRMGQSDFFATVLTFGEVARLVEFVEDVDDWDSHTAPEEKTQRKLNVQRVDREMVPYLVETDDHFYSALTVEVRPSIDDGGADAIPFRPVGTELPGGIQYGEIVLDGTQILCALDGQHRLKSIQRAIRLKQSLAREQLAVILVPFRSPRLSQLLFSDLNRYAKGPSRSINLLFSHRDPIVMLTKRLIASVPFLTGRVELESTSLSKNTPSVITLSSLYEMTRTLLGRRPLDGERIDDEVTRQTQIWRALVRAIPQWASVEDRSEHPAYLRAGHLSMHGVGQQAIAIAATRLLEAQDGDCAALARLRDIDWSIANPEFQGIAVQGRRVNNTAATVRNLGALILDRLGCGISDGEARTLVEARATRVDFPPTRVRKIAGEEAD